MPASVIAIEGNGTTGVEQGAVPAEATTDITGLSLDFVVETPGIMFSEPRLARLLVVEANTNSQTLTAIVVHDTTATTLNSTISTAAKSRVEIPIALVGSIFSVRLSATGLTSRIEISAIELDIADPA